MGGTKTGGMLARETNRKLYGSDFYARIGAIGGRKSVPSKGFASMPFEKVSAAGRKGGLVSKRKPMLR